MVQAEQVNCCPEELIHSSARELQLTHWAMLKRSAPRSGKTSPPLGELKAAHEQTFQQRGKLGRGVHLYKEGTEYKRRERSHQGQPRGYYNYKKI